MDSCPDMPNCLTNTQVSYQLVRLCQNVDMGCRCNIYIWHLSGHSGRETYMIHILSILQGLAVLCVFLYDYLYVSLYDSQNIGSIHFCRESGQLRNILEVNVISQNECFIPTYSLGENMVCMIQVGQNTKLICRRLKCASLRHLCIQIGHREAGNHKMLFEKCCYCRLFWKRKIK